MAYAAVTSLMGTLSLHFLQSQPRFPLEDLESHIRYGNKNLELLQEILEDLEASSKRLRNKALHRIPLTSRLREVTEVKQKIASLYKNLGLLQQFLDKPEIAANDYAAMKYLEAKIRDVFYKTGKKIEMELSVIYLAKVNLRITVSLRLHTLFNRAVKHTYYLQNELIKITKGKGSSLIGSTSSRPDLEGSEFSNKASKFDNRMVGCDKEFMRIMDQLTRQSAKQRQVVSIVGMGGIGKTTLARKVYEDSSITFHFDKRAWTTVSQDYYIEQILRCLIGFVSESSGEVHDQDNLAESLYKLLKGQRYLIVIDDIWSTTAWDSVQRCFPDDDNGSRILLTSRLKEVAEYASSGNSPLNMPFLDADESWNLYCKVFGKMELLVVFDQIGRDIVKKCKGLPLAIILVAGLLSKTEEVVEKWKNVAENVSRFVIGDSNEACSRVLSLSYNHLPGHLKACFLYFGVFPEDYEIPVKKLVRLWAAEGFLGGVKHRNMEEVAMEYLQDLVDRSLVIVRKQSYNGEMKTIGIHDLLRDLCLREARCEELLNFIENLYHGAVGRFMLSKRCPWLSISPLCFNIPVVFKFFNKFHSLHCFEFIDLSIEVFCSFKLLRVVDMKLGFWNFGNKVLNTESLVHLRYLALSLNGKVFCLQLQLFEHWNMQSFIIRGSGTFDSSQAYRIWKMPLLRNFYVEGIPFSLEIRRLFIDT